MSTDTSPERRDFLRTSTGIVIGLGCLAGVSVRALRQAAAADERPPFTDGTLQKLLDGGIPGAAIEDPKGFVLKSFYLEPEQEKRLESIAPEEWGQVQQALQVAVKYERPVVFRASECGKRGPVRLLVKEDESVVYVIAE